MELQDIVLIMWTAGLLYLVVALVRVSGEVEYCHDALVSTYQTTL
jgi:hypothetical protein